MDVATATRLSANALQTIVALRPNMTREQLFRQILPKTPLGRLRKLLSPIRGVAEVYVPFNLFQIDVLNASRRDTKQLAIDAVTGTLDLYAVDADQSFTDVMTRNAIPAALDLQQTENAAIDKVRRLVFRGGFFSLRDVRFTASWLKTFHVPYWIVMLGAERDLRLRIFDAVRCRPEGAKVRSLIRNWLNAP